MGRTKNWLQQSHARSREQLVGSNMTIEPMQTKRSNVKGHVVITGYASNIVFVR